MHDLTAFSRLIGSGLTNNHCRICLDNIEGKGLFWPFKHSDKSGVWCDYLEWNAAFLKLIGTEKPDLVPDDLMSVLQAAILSPLGELFTQNMSLEYKDNSGLSGIYPVVDCGGYRLVLVGGTLDSIKNFTQDWIPCEMKVLEIKIPLIVGYTNNEVNRGQGVWLSEYQNPNKGHAILWWNRPIAKIEFVGEQQWLVTEIFPLHTLSEPVAVAQIGSLHLDINTLSNLDEGQNITGSLENEPQVKLVYQDICLSKGELLINDNGVIFRAT